MFRAMAAVLIGLAGSAGIFACGGSALEEAPPCTAPTPTPGPRPGQSSSNFQYVQRIEGGARRLTELLTTFRGAWPDNTFYRSGSFRQDFVNYAGRATCLANDLAALAPPSSRFSEFRASWPLLMQEYTAIAARGLEAIEQRNTSGYRDWARDVDEIEAKVAAAVTALKEAD